jgi:hypothetical protein
VTKNDKQMLVVFVVAIVLAPLIYLIASTAERELKLTFFYRAHPLLAGIRDVPNNNGWRDSPAGRSVLLKYVPLGTDKTAAFATLSQQGFECREVPWPPTQAERTLDGLGSVDPKGQLVACYAKAPEGMGQTDCYIHLVFDAQDIMSDAKVRIDYIFL